MPNKQNNEHDRYLANALIRGLEIIKLFNVNHPSLTLSEIAKMLGVSRSVPFRLTYTLEKLGYLRLDQTSKKYSLTPKVMELGLSYLSSLTIRDIVHPYLQEITDKTDAAAHLGILDNLDVIYVDRTSPVGVSTVTIHLGVKLPAQLTSMGKVLLAFNEDTIKLVDRITTKLADGKGDASITKQNLLDELKLTKKLQYATSIQEFEAGINSISVPIFNRTGDARFAINVAGSATKFPKEKLIETILPLLRRSSQEISNIYVKG